MIAGALLALIGLECQPKQFYAWLLAFMFFLSLGLGVIFWSSSITFLDAGCPVRHPAFLRAHQHAPLSLSVVLFLPIAIWGANHLSVDAENPATDKRSRPNSLCHSAGFYVMAAFCFLVWFVLSRRLRYWSLQQGSNGAALPTYRMRFLSGHRHFFPVCFDIEIAAVIVDESLCSTKWFLDDVRRLLFRR